jgi:hypothetical protein
MSWTDGVFGTHAVLWVFGRAFGCDLSNMKHDHAAH